MSSNIDSAYVPIPKGQFMPRSYRNISFATAASFAALLEQGERVFVSASDTKETVETKELRNWVTVLDRPTERCVFLPGRRHDIFAQVAETLWVIGGRDDVAWLSHYVPRAPQYSDDGERWRAGYGPRLRRWGGSVDQLRGWLTVLEQDHSTRRAAGVLFDPASDFIPTSKDIPCNNWLSWLIRDERLHLTVGVRSNDALWGFSGVNAFEWSVLQEMMAFWLGVGVGDATYVATSYHYYTARADQVEAVVDGFYGLSPYDFGMKTAPFQTPWANFDGALQEWFKQEEAVRENPDAPLDPSLFADPFLTSTLRLIRLKWGGQRWTKSRLSNELAALPDEDLTAAAYERFGRKHPDLLDHPPQPSIRSFFSAWRAAKETGKFDLPAAINALHARKNVSYASSWKRRGERISILPNIARKVDRLDAISRNAPDLQGETALDTAVDLYVYTIKYLLFLFEKSETPVPLRRDAPRPYSDHDANFNAIANGIYSSPAKPGVFSNIAEQISTVFEDLTQSAERGKEVEQRIRPSQRLARLAWQLVSTVAAVDPRSAAVFTRAEEAYAHSSGQPANG